MPRPCLSLRKTPATTATQTASRRLARPRETLCGCRRCRHQSSGLRRISAGVSRVARPVSAYRCGRAAISCSAERAQTMSTRALTVGSTFPGWGFARFPIRRRAQTAGGASGDGGRAQSSAAASAVPLRQVASCFLHVVRRLPNISALRGARARMMGRPERRGHASEAEHRVPSHFAFGVSQLVIFLGCTRRGSL
eukprot:5346529-Prymnesium_polylepis.1